MPVLPIFTAVISRRERDRFSSALKPQVTSFSGCTSTSWVKGGWPGTVIVEGL